MDLDAGSSIAAFARPRPELEGAPVELHGVIVLDGALVLNGADAVEVPQDRGRAPCALDVAGAWRALATWLAVPRITLLGEPPGVDELLGRWSGDLDLRGGHWTDAYLAAFAAASGCRLVAFDGEFRRYPGVEFLHLTS